MMLAAAPAQLQARTAAPGKARPKPASRRREVKVGGRRVKTIDVHAHCVIPEALALLGKRLDDQRGPGIGEVGERRIREMDEQGIDMEALSINPQWYRAERDLVTQVVKIQNERLAEFCATYPDRFVAFASVALQYPDLAVQQLVDGVKRLGLRGAAVGASVAGKEFSDPMFHPFWAKAEELGVLIFIHPQSTPDLAPRLKGNGWLANTIGNPLDTTVALGHLVFDGVLERFPKLKLVAAHGGGYVAHYPARMDHVWGARADARTVLKNTPRRSLAKVYFDTIVFDRVQLEHLVKLWGADHVLAGTDYPYDMGMYDPRGFVGGAALTAADKAKILGLNAARLLKVRVPAASKAGRARARR